MKRDYSKFSEKELNHEISEFKLRLLKSNVGVKSKEHIQNKPRLRKEIARLKTELNSRKQGKK